MPIPDSIGVNDACQARLNACVATGHADARVCAARQADHRGMSVLMVFIVRCSRASDGGILLT